MLVDITHHGIRNFLIHAIGEAYNSQYLIAFLRNFLHSSLFVTNNFIALYKESSSASATNMFSPCLKQLGVHYKKEYLK